MKLPMSWLGAALPNLGAGKEGRSDEAGRLIVAMKAELYCLSLRM